METFLGPLISENDVKRVDSWVKEAVDAGAHVIVGGKSHGTVYGNLLLGLLILFI
jgi:acyl-CoA reductase-like NAD-dependent aldehyde dehydrogenase